MEEKIHRKMMRERFLDILDSFRIIIKGI